MPSSPRLPARLLIAAAALILAAMACSLDLAPEDARPSQPSAPQGGQEVAGAEKTAPTVRIVAPADGATVPIGQPVDIEVETDRTATGFLLSEGGQVRSIINMPEGQTGPTKAILSWTPGRAGNYSLEVIATNRSSTSAPAALSLVAAGTVSAPGATACAGRVMVTELNYRDGPSTGAKKLGQFEVGETVMVIGRNSENTWYRVQRTNSEQVWVINNAQWLKLEGPCGDLPFAQ
ncbi:MAG TPA: SH3 domain-containing protein [Aggregatilineaceae bacterium]|nr:SH3 domain-containing protein [Anaerolineae bacterium]HMM29016.1 SH3 domain-containing protein [Aggregatilineaceae bacterium]